MATILLGIILGFFFGLTGSGGSTLATPLLIYGVGFAPHRAVCVSMITVGAMAALRAIQKLRAREIEFRTGGMLTACGLIGAPAGAWVGRTLPEKWLLFLFSALVVVVALRMLFRNVKPTTMSDASPIIAPLKREDASSCAPTSIPMLAAAGFGTGILAGLFGVGGGFVIVPALILFCGMEIHRAIATSMFTIAMVSAAAMGSHWLAGQRPPLDSVALFTLGGLLGLTPGCLLANKLSGRFLQRLFAIAMLCLAAFIVIHSLKRS